jgi:prepilin-type N-terminal cleavage/methylation domain-containing protein/prepilin-type processing-associated H-X9-DG protein
MARRNRNGFTLVELLVVVGIIAVLISILLPALGRARDSAQNAKCMSQLHNIGAAVLMYANENKGKLPQHGSDAIWLWDVAFATRDALVKKGGERRTLYCPNFPEQNVDELWNGTFGNTTHNYAVLGYFWMGRRTTTADPRVTSPNLPNLAGRSYLESLKMPAKPVVAPTAAPRFSSEVEVMSDPVVFQDGRGWTAMGSWNQLHVTAHADRKGLPVGANILFLDWHVSMRPYKDPARAGVGADILRRRGAWGNPQIQFWF